MDNPFKKRATEYVPDVKAFLPLVCPTPIEEFFRPDPTGLLEKLTIVVGTPGSGKTTIAKVIEFESLDEISKDLQGLNSELANVLHQLQLIKDGHPTLLSFRLEITPNFRNIWELPYSEKIRGTLLRAFIQAKSVIGWFRLLDEAEADLTTLTIDLKDQAHGNGVGLTDGNPLGLREFARSIEKAIFEVVTALSPPDEQQLIQNHFTHTYDIFDAINSITLGRWHDGNAAYRIALHPMVVIDDAHELHPKQFSQINDWLKQRSIKIGRWIMCRPDAIAPDLYRHAILNETEQDNSPGTKSGRDYILRRVQFQSSANKKSFQRITTDIGNRYVSAISLFSRRGIKNLTTMLPVSRPQLNKKDLSKLRQDVDKLLEDGIFGTSLVDSLTERIPQSLPEEERLAVLRILLYRELKRTPQLSMLATEDPLEEPKTREKKTNSALIDGARLQLMHEFNRPFFYGIEKLVTASNNNIEQFIRLSEVVVDKLIALSIKNRKLELPPKVQHETLVKAAQDDISSWDFPYNENVKRLVKSIANLCIEKTLQANAPLDSGAIAIGIPQLEMDSLLSKSERLSNVLHYAVAYNALNYLPNYKCKGRAWSLLELGGIPCLAYGITLHKGGFIESNLTKLKRLAEE